MAEAPLSSCDSRLMLPSESWRTTYPGAAAGILALGNVVNPTSHTALNERKTEIEARLRTQFGHLSREELRAQPALRAYADYYRRFGNTYHVQLQLESVALKGKSIPRVAALVEAMFMAEMTNLLLTAGHDLDRLELPLRLDVATGDETYTRLNGHEQTLKAGDMYMADGVGVISSVLHGPDERSQIRAGTTGVLFAVYAPAGIGTKAVASHLDDIAANVRLLAPDAEIIATTVLSAK